MSGKKGECAGGSIRGGFPVRATESKQVKKRSDRGGSNELKRLRTFASRSPSFKSSLRAFTGRLSNKKNAFFNKNRSAAYICSWAEILYRKGLLINNKALLQSNTSSLPINTPLPEGNTSLRPSRTHRVQICCASGK
jgi:hypothetical protein